MTNYHQPVLLEESIAGLEIQPKGTYLDVTFGGGGHSREILSHLQGGRLISMDQDKDAVENAKFLQEDPQFQFIAGNFRYAENYLKMMSVKGVDGILADLGVSSHQFDSPERGFSTRFQGNLDMRMNQQQETSALTVVNEYAQDSLADVLYQYGELKNSRGIAAELVRQRTNNPLTTIEDLKKSIGRFAPRGKENQFLARVFQALRIEVNQELEILEEFLEQAVQLLKSNGRLVVISYHSLEDRRVKNFFSAGNFSGEQEKDLYGNVIRPLRPVTRKPVVPSPEEIARNNRARSAKMRIAEKI